MLCCNKTWKNKKIIKLIQNLRTKLLNIFEKIYVIFAENFILIKCNKNIIENFQRILFKICEKILIKKYEKINFIHFLLIYIIIILFWWWPDLGTWLSWPLLLWAGIFMYWRKKRGDFVFLILVSPTFFLLEIIHFLISILRCDGQNSCVLKTFRRGSLVNR